MNKSVDMQLATDIGGIDWHRVGSHVGLMLLAYVLALPIAWDREQSARGAGLRTFQLVAVGSCGFMLIGLSVLSGSESHDRILYGLITASALSAAVQY